MSREIRMVPKNWEHPKDENGDYIPMFEGSFVHMCTSKWDLGENMWDNGFIFDYEKQDWVKKSQYQSFLTYEQWPGNRINEDEHMPNWDKSEKTHYMLYETTSEGTPKSPACSTPEELAQWLVDNNVPWFADYTTDYENWIKIIKGECDAIPEFTLK